jgi:hypothetical protein
MENACILLALSVIECTLHTKSTPENLASVVVVNRLNPWQFL